MLLAVTALNIRLALRTKDALACYNLGIDTDKYDGAARRIASTGVVDVPTLQPPGYILYLALLYRLLGPRVIVPKLLACAMVLGLSVGVWAYGRRFVGEGAAFAGAVLTITSPVFRAYASTLQYEVLAAFLFSASIAVVLAATHGSTRRRRFVSLSAASILCVVTTLTRETFLVVFPVLLLYVAVSTKGEKRERTEMVTAMAVIFVAVLGSWSVWQHRRTGQWVLVSQKGPLVLQFGNNPNANGTYNATLKPVVSPAGWEFIQARPWMAAKLAVRKFVYFFGFLKDGWNVPRASALLIARLTFGAVSLVVCEALARSTASVFALGGAVVILATRRLRRELWVLPAVIGATLGLHVVSISSHRFAIPRGRGWLQPVTPVCTRALRARTSMETSQTTSSTSGQATGTLVTRMRPAAGAGWPS
jgi:Dolichyl-phosphate-mannose-protein mannosyltransferase